MFMTDAACQRCAESRAPQPRTGPASRSGPAIRCSYATCEGMFHISSSSPSLSRTSSASEDAYSGQRSQAGIYRQASAKSDSASSVVRHNQTTLHQRGSKPGVARAAAARARAWVSRDQLGHGPAVWNIDLIACCRKSWRKPTSCWSRKNGGRWPGVRKRDRKRGNPVRR
jgi:hypothetical protein